MASVSSRSTPLSSLSYGQLFQKGEFCEIASRVVEAVMDFFTKVCEYISLFLNSFCEWLSEGITWLVTDSQELERRERAAEMERQRIAAGNRSVIMSFFNFSSAPLSVTTPSHQAAFNRISGPLKRTLASYQNIPSTTPAFEKKVLQLSDSLISAKDKEDMKFSYNPALFCRLMIRALLFQAKPVHFGNSAGSETFKAPDYMNKYSSDIQRMQAGFWDLTDAEKAIIYDHIDSEIKTIAGKTHLVPPQGQTPEERRSVAPSQCEISGDALRLYGKIGVLANRMQQGNPPLCEALPKVFPQT